MAKHTEMKNLTAGGWVRLALYVVLVLTSLFAILAPAFGLGGYVDTAYAVIAVLGALTGGTAALNIPNAADQKVKPGEVMSSIRNLGSELHDLRTSTPDLVADRVYERTKAKPVDAGAAKQKPAVKLPVYGGLESN